MSNKSPEVAFGFRHRQPVQLRFIDIDPLGHVNNAVYFQLMDLAKYKYFSALGGVLDGDITVVVVNVNCDFYSPAYLDEPLEVLTAVESIGDKSLRLEQRVVDPASGDVKCVCRTVMAGFDRVAVRGVEIPADWHRRISAFEGREM